MDNYKDMIWKPLLAVGQKTAVGAPSPPQLVFTLAQSLK